MLPFDEKISYLITEKFFNTAGPINPAMHYCLPPLHRFDLDEVLRLIAQHRYFVLHAPRQTGKTSSLLALQDYLSELGDYREQRIVVEIKLLYRSLDATIQTGLTQTKVYMDMSGADEGHLLIFDRSPSKSWDEKIFTREEDGIVVWGQ